MNIVTKYTVFIFFFLIYTTTSIAQTSIFDQEWKAIDTLEHYRLVDSALGKTTILLKTIKSSPQQKGWQAHYLKALVFKHKYLARIAENSPQSPKKPFVVIPKHCQPVPTQISNQLIPELYVTLKENNDNILKAITHYAIGHFLQDFYSSNEYCIDNRDTIYPYDPNNIPRWSKDSFKHKITYHYKKALSYKATQKTSVVPYMLLTNLAEEFKEFGLDTLKKRIPYTWNLRPTLYDLLGHHFLNFTTGSYSIYGESYRYARAAYRTAQPRPFRCEINPPKNPPVPKRVYLLQDSLAFLPLDQFLISSFDLKDTIISRVHKLKVYQELLQFHKENKTLNALADLDYSRLQYAQSACSPKDETDLYEATLNAMAKTYKKQSIYSQIAHKFAEEDYNNNDYIKAYNRCQEAIELHPNSYGATKCKSLIRKIKKVNLSLGTELAYPPKKPILVKLQYKNADTLYAKFVKLPNTLKQPHDSLVNKWEPQTTWVHILPNFGDFKEHSTEIALPAMPVGRYRLILSKNPNFKLKENSILYTTIQVTDLAIVQQDHDKNSSKLYILSRSTGAPIKNALVNLEQYKNNKTSYFRAHTGEDGSLVLKKGDKYDYKSLRVVHKKDQFTAACQSNSYYYYSSYSCNVNTTENLKDTSYQGKIFTDRGIYRPGQPLYFKGIVWQRLPNGEKQVAANTATEVTLHDVNGQKIKSFAFITNEYGSYSDSLILPTGGLLGKMTLKETISQTRQSFRVEEYKKPTFEASFNSYYRTVIYYDTLKATGQAKTFLGSNVDGASVRYTVTMRTTKSKNSRYEVDSIIHIGTTTTDKNGKFVASFIALTDTFHPRYCQYYKIRAEITDLTGETKVCHTEVRALDSAYYYRGPEPTPEPEVYQVLDYLKLFIPNKTTTNDLKITLQGFDKRKIPFSKKGPHIRAVYDIKAIVRIEKLKTPNYPYYSRYWGQVDTITLNQEEFQKQFPYFQYAKENDWKTWSVEKRVLEQQFHFKNDTFKYCNPDASQWEQGSYRVRVIYTDNNRSTPKPDTLVQHFVLTNPTHKQVPANDPLFILDEVQTGYPGDTVWLDLGGYYKNTQVLFTLEYNDQIDQNYWIKLNGRKKLPIYIEDKHRGNIHYHLLTIRDNRVHVRDGKITVPWDDKNLKVEYLSFRNKLLPGQQEEWQIKITGINKDKVAAEVLATLYDAALDQLAYHNWSKHSYPYQSDLTTSWSSSNNFSSKHFNFQSSFGYYNDYSYKNYLKLISPKQFYKFNRRWSANGEIWYSANGEGAERDLKESEYATRSANEAAYYDSEIMSEAEPEPEIDVDAPETSNKSYVRKDLRETIFFFPHLQTDKDGNVIIKFKMGENLSRWKFMLYAHSKELHQALSTKTLVTQKKLMIKPNPPRFLKQGDAIDFVAKVINLDDTKLAGKATLQLFDALNMKAIDAAWANTASSVSFDIKSGESQRVSWAIKVPADWTNPITYRVIAKSANIADGEEASLPVHSSRILLSEALPLYTKGNDRDTFLFKRMLNPSSTLQHHRLTLEFTPNPVWYAVQSMPYLMDYPHDCSEQLFSKYYANSLASSVINSHPKIKAALEHFSETDGPASNDRLAQLKANPQLKSAILEETPWVLKSQSKSQKYKELNVLFNLNSMAKKAEEVRNKLAERQSKDGSFSWFPGGNGNGYITQYIVAGMGHLTAMDANLLEDDNKTDEMIGKAVDYLEKGFVDQYLAFLKQTERSPNYKKLRREHEPNAKTIHLLYALSFFDYLEPSSPPTITDKAIRYYSHQCELHWNKQTLYTQAMIALTLYRLDDKNSTAQIIMDTIRSKAIYSDREGMHWENKWSYYWYNQCIETHTQLIEAFGEIKKDTQTVEAIKQWILQQRIDGHWGTTKSTTLATYALLKTGQSWLADPKPVDITLGDKKIDPPSTDKAEAFTGYFEESWEGKDVNTKMSNIVVDNPNPYPVMGALHWQYFEQLDKVTSFKDTPLKLNRKLYKEIATPQGAKLVSIDSTELKPGDLIKVQIELTVEKQMEYLHLKDMRAAGFEPVNVLSGYKGITYRVGYYESTKDAATHFFFDYLPKGNYKFEYPLRVQHKGNFTNGVATIQCMYAPEFTSHSKGIRVQVK